MNLGRAAILKMFSLSLSLATTRFILLRYITTRIRTSSLPTHTQAYMCDRYLMTRKYHRDDIILSLDSLLVHPNVKGEDHVFDI